MIRLIVFLVLWGGVQDTTKHKKTERYDYEKLQLKMKKQVVKVDSVKMDTAKRQYYEVN